MKHRIIQGLMVFLLLAITLPLVCHSSLTVGAADIFSTKIAAADTTVTQAFEAVLDVERTGGNVSSLMPQLDEAGKLLADARIAYGVGALDEANAKAESAISIAGSVRNSALSLRESALAEAQNVFWVSLVASLTEAAAFVVVLLLVWVWFRRVYARRILGMKPEVVNNA